MKSGIPSFSTRRTRGSRPPKPGTFSSAAVTDYYGAQVPTNGSDHLNGVIDPASGQGAFGYEYYGQMPRKRWIFTKLDLR